MAAWLGLGLDTFDEWLTQVRGVSVLSMDKPLAHDTEGHAFTALAQLAAETPGSCERRDQELKAHLAEAIDALPQQEKIVLSLYYFEELTMHEIGQVLELTLSRISQIHTKAIFHLRAALPNLTYDAYATVASAARGMPPAAAVTLDSRLLSQWVLEPGLALAPAHLIKESRMAMHPVIDDLDRCKIALQYIAEGQSDHLTVVLELLVERLEDAIGQAAAQLRQCTRGLRPASGDAQCYAARCPHRPPGSQQTPLPSALRDAADRDAAEEGPGPDASPAGAEGSREQHLGASHSPAAFDFPYVIE